MKNEIMLEVASLFSGIGGIDLGFSQAGFKVVFANEFDKDAIKTYRLNFPNTFLDEGDVRLLDFTAVPDFDVLVAGFPCQPFSVVGKQKGFADPRGNLFFEITRMIDVKRPKVVFLENVANLLEHDNGKTFLVIFNSLAQFGYIVRYKIMDSQDYANIPQKRKRIFIVAFLSYKQCCAFKYPTPQTLTVSQCDIIDRSVQKHRHYYYNESSFYYYDLVKIVTEKNVLYKIGDSGVSRQKCYVCPTLLANMGTYPDRVPIIKDNFGIRKLTPSECLTFQGFPPDFMFPNISENSMYKQIGNSVTVPLVKILAEQIKLTF